MRECIFALLVVAALSQVPFPPPSIGYPSFNGTGNNVANPLQGSSGSLFIRTYLGSGYSGARPNPRNVSQTLFGRPVHVSAAAPAIASSLLANWGQFLVHMITMTAQNASASDPIPVPACDPVLDPGCTGTKTIPYTHPALFPDPQTAISVGRNLVPTYLHLGNIYGNTPERSAIVRNFTGGLLNLDPNGMLPQFGTQFCGRADAAVKGGTCPALRLRFAGDARVNLNPFVLALATIFTREHNRRATLMAAQYPNWSDERLFQEARLRTIGLMQAITYREYLPLLLGSWYSRLPAYTGYNASVDVSLDVFFTSGSFRYGHTALAAAYPLLKEDWTPLSSPLILRDLILENSQFTNELMEAMLRGSMQQSEPVISPHVGTDLRNFAPGAVDIASTDIMRGRDFQLPSHNVLRQHYGIPQHTLWSQVSPDKEVQDILRGLYEDIDAVDPWVAGNCEPKLSTNIMGPLFSASVVDQFGRLRAGDRFFYDQLTVLRQQDISEIKGTTLSDVIKRNTNITWLPKSVFTVTPVRPSTSSSSSDSTAEKVSQTSPLAGYTVKWQIIDKEILVTMIHSGPLVGWMGMGFGTNMINTDLIIAYISATSASVVDSFTSDHNPQADTVLGTPSNVDPAIVSFEALSDGSVTVSFRRLLDTGDSKDAVIRPGLMNMIFAHNLVAGSTTYHGGDSRVQSQVDFFTGESTAAVQPNSPTRNVQTMHGLTMFLTWLVVYPVGAWIARYMKHKKWWLIVHKTLMSTGVVSAASFILVALLSVDSKSRVWKTHSWLGLTIIAVLVLQTVAGYSATYLKQHATLKFFKFRPILRRFHQCTGALLMLIAPTQCYYGILNLNPQDVTYTSALGAWCAIILAWFVVSEIVRVRREKTFKRQVEPDKDSNLPEVTWEEVSALVRLGTMLLVVDGLVINITNWVAAHPGGRALLEMRVGTDVTAIFHGVGPFRFHKHSSYAFQSVRTLAKYRLKGYVHEGLVSNGAEMDVVEPEQRNRVFAESRLGGFHVTDRTTLIKEAKTRLAVVCISVTFPPQYKDVPALGTAFQPGQHLYVQATVDGEIIERPYTPVSLTGQPGCFEFVLKVYPKGSMSQYLMKFDKSHLLRIRGPGGTPLVNRHAPNGCWRHLLMLAGGSGITPMHQLIRFHDDRRRSSPTTYSSQLILLDFNSTAADIIFRTELAAFADAAPENFSVHHVLSNPEPSWSEHVGRISANSLRTIVGDRLEVFLKPARGRVLDDPYAEGTESLGTQQARLHGSGSASGLHQRKPVLNNLSGSRSSGGRDGSGGMGARQMSVDSINSGISLPGTPDNVSDSREPLLEEPAKSPRGRRGINKVTPASPSVSDGLTVPRQTTMKSRSADKSDRGKQADASASASVAEIVLSVSSPSPVLGGPLRGASFDAVEERLVVVCGPPAFVDAAVQALKIVGVPDGIIFPL